MSSGKLVEIKREVIVVTVSKNRLVMLSDVRFTVINTHTRIIDLTHNSPEYLEWNLALEKLGGIFFH